MYRVFQFTFWLMCSLWCVYSSKKYGAGTLQFWTGLLDFALLYGLVTVFILEK